MIKANIFYVSVLGVFIILVLSSLHYKGGDDAMVAQVESQVMAISYQKPVLIRNIFVSHGQVVDSGDILLVVERPDLALDLDKKLTEKTQLQKRIEEAQAFYNNSLKILQSDYKRKVNVLNSDKQNWIMNYAARIKGKRKWMVCHLLLSTPTTP